MPPRLPFGRTATTAAEITEQLDVSRAGERLAAEGVSSPRDRIETFIGDLPGLLSWLESNGRVYPWRLTTDPWKVYISEILLQRTRADAVAEIHEEFFEKYPGPKALHSAPESAIRETVHSLGFGDQRTRTLKECADMIVNRHDGSVPASLDALRSPWRAGDYSARATLLFAFQQPQPLVDANIARIIGRYFKYTLPQQPHKDRGTYDLMGALTPTDPGLARAVYLGLLDLGALLCTADSPHCSNCPLSGGCHFPAENRESA